MTRNHYSSLHQTSTFKGLVSFTFDFYSKVLFVLIFILKVPKVHPENRFGLGTPEKNTKAELKVEAGSRSRSFSSRPTSPKPLLQSPKPSLSVRPTIPQKPRTASRPGKGFAGQEVTPRPGLHSWFPGRLVNLEEACVWEGPWETCQSDKGWRVPSFSAEVTHSGTVLALRATARRQDG